MNFLNTIFQKVFELFNWWFTVVPWERAVRVRLGKHVRVLEPGIHIQLPFIDKVYVLNVRDRIAATTPQNLTTRDGITLTIQAAIRFSIDDILPLYTRLHQADDTICQEIEGHISDYIIRHDAVDCTPQQVIDYVKSEIDLSQYGLNCTEVFFTDYVKVKTYRFIQGALDRYQSSGVNLSHERKDKYGDY